MIFEVMKIKSVCGVILTTKNMEKMVKFYRDVLGFPLQKEEHTKIIHYGCDIGKTHFAIHPPQSFGLKSSGNSTAKMAFEVDNLENYVKRLKENGFMSFSEQHDEGFGPVASFKDPDGNLIELVELRYEFKE